MRWCIVVPELNSDPAIFALPIGLALTLRVECPRCGVDANVDLHFTQGEMGINDYEGVCLEELEDGGNCGISLLLTATLPQEEAE